VHTVGRNIGNPKRFMVQLCDVCVELVLLVKTPVRNGGQKDGVTSKIFYNIDLLQYQLSSIHIFL
jgi:hypothetical protein